MMFDHTFNLARYRARKEEQRRRTTEAWQRLRMLSEAHDAYCVGDRRALRSFFEDYVGHKTDSLAWTAVTSRMPEEREDLLVRPFLVFLQAHGERLAHKSERSPERRAEVQRYDKSLYRYGELRQALADYEGPEAERREVRRAVYVRERKLAPGEALTPGAVEHQIKADNGLTGESVERPRPGERLDVYALNSRLWHVAAPRHERGIAANNRLAPLDALPELSGFFQDPGALDAYRGVERPILIEQLIARAGLPPRELEAVALLLSGLEPKEAAARLGVAWSTARVVLRRAYLKLAAAS